MTQDLARQFDAAMLETYHESKRIGYNATYFLRSLNEHGGVATARRLINAQAPSDGFTRLWELGRLDLSVEAVALEARWRPLFSGEELRRAAQRLADYGYRPWPGGQRALCPAQTGCRTRFTS
jgi:hypothetical protein